MRIACQAERRQRHIRHIYQLLDTLKSFAGRKTAM